MPFASQRRRNAVVVERFGDAVPALPPQQPFPVDAMNDGDRVWISGDELDPLLLALAEMVRGLPGLVGREYFQTLAGLRMHAPLLPVGPATQPMNREPVRRHDNLVDAGRR